MVYDRLAFGISNSGKGEELHTWPAPTATSTEPNTDSQNRLLKSTSVLFMAKREPKNPFGAKRCERVNVGESSFTGIR